MYGISRIRRAVVRCAGIALLVTFATAVAVPAAKASYVFFYRTIGDWVVLCTGDAATGAKQCDLKAPPPSLSRSGVQNVISVREPAENTYEVVIDVRDIVVPGLPAFVRVDGFAIHEAQIDAGRAVWSGDEALAIISEMRAGLTVVYRVQTVPDGLPRDMHVSLSGFRNALSLYRSVLRAHNLVAKGS